MIPAYDTSQASTHWLKITLFCPLILLDAATDLLGVLSGAGVEQSPENAEGAFVSGFFPWQISPDAAVSLQQAESDERIAFVEARMSELFALYGSTLTKPTVTILADQDWATSWQQYFKPIEIVPGLVIKPSWEDYQADSGQCVIEMDPGMAFGTGQHASTQMALSLILSSMEINQPQQVLDVGTGTGILAMAAALFGANQVIAIDNDPDAVIVAQENIQQNALDGKIRASGLPLEEISGSFALISANIVHDVLVDMAPALNTLIAPGGHLILAGILKGEQEENIVQVYRILGMQLLARRHQEEWAALLLMAGVRQNC